MAQGPSDTILVAIRITLRIRESKVRNPDPLYYSLIVSCRARRRFVLSERILVIYAVPSVLWRCWLGGMKGIRPVKKNWVVGCWRGCLGWGADLHIAQQMPLTLTVSCSSKSRLVLPSWILPFRYQLTQVVPDKFQKSSKTTVCVCVCYAVVFLDLLVVHLPFCNIRFSFSSTRLSDWLRRTYPKWPALSFVT